MPAPSTAATSRLSPAARQMRDGEIDAAVGDDVYRAYAVPKRDGHHFLTSKDE